MGDERPYSKLLPVEQLLAVQRVIDEHVVPYVQGHGGTIELRGVEGNLVEITLGGACGDCIAKQITSQLTVQATLREKLHDQIEVKHIEFEES